MGLKIRCFRARLNIETTKRSTSELRELTGVYRSQPFEVASAAPVIHRPYNAATSSSVHTSHLPSSSKPLSPLPSTSQTFKTKPQKKRLAPSLENTLAKQSQASQRNQENSKGERTQIKYVPAKGPLSKPSNAPPSSTTGQSQPSDSKGTNTDDNRSNNQLARPKNPLAIADKHDELSKAKGPLQSIGQNMKPKVEVPAHKNMAQKAQPRVTHHDDSSSFEFAYSSPTQLQLLDNNHTSVKPTPDGASAVKLTVPIPPHVTEQEESESES